MGGDVDRAEEAVQDAYAVAVERWPREGVPETPVAWILTTAKRRAIDRLRREAALRDKQALLARELEAAVEDLPGDDPEMIPTSDSGWSSPAATRRSRWRRRCPSPCGSWAG